MINTILSHLKEIASIPKETIKHLKSVTPQKIYSFFESYFKQKFAPTYIKEQVILRTVLAEKCVLNGSCEFCGCSLSGQFDKRYSSVACDKKYNNLPYCYGEFVSEKDWIESKKLLDWESIKVKAELINEKRKAIRRSAN